MEDDFLSDPIEHLCRRLEYLEHISGQTQAIKFTSQSLKQKIIDLHRMTEGNLSEKMLDTMDLCKTYKFFCGAICTPLISFN